MNEEEFAEYFVQMIEEAFPFAEEEGQLPGMLKIDSIKVVPEGVYLTKDTMIQVRLKDNTNWLLTVQKDASR